LQKRRFVLLLELSVSFLAAQFAVAAVLFPEPLHLTRTIESPVTHKAVVVDEYCAGNRVISVTEDRTVIADYEKGELTEIDRAHSTYSITKFEDLAKANNVRAPRASSTSDASWRVRPTARRANADYVEAEPNDDRDLRKLEVGVDRNVRLSRAAAEVLAGTAFPNVRTDESTLVLNAAAPAARQQSRTRSESTSVTSADVSYGLPVEQTATVRVGGKEVVTRNRITRVGNEAPPASALVIPNGARLVESTAVQRRRLLDEIETLPAPRARP